MAQKKYSISLNGLPDHERIIFKLICSVSERTRNRNKAYTLKDAEPASSDIYINDIKNKSSLNKTLSFPINVWISNNLEHDENIITRPLIATRVLNALDKLTDNCDTSDSEHNRASLQPENELRDSSEYNTELNFDISEEEASELAIVHDDILENPANQENPESHENIGQRSPELKLINNKLASQPAPCETSGIRNVLVVDDSASVRKQLEIELEFFNTSVDFAESAESAFNLLDSKKYDVALLDVVLPDKDGFQICKRIKAGNKSTIAIMLTGKATQADKIKGSLAGCNAYLVKPVGRQTFQNTIKNYLPFKSTKQAVKA